MSIRFDRKTVEASIIVQIMQLEKLYKFKEKHCQVSSYFLKVIAKKQFFKNFKIQKKVG